MNIERLETQSKGLQLTIFVQNNIKEMLKVFKIWYGTEWWGHL